MQFWEDAFLDAVSQERDMIGMDQVGKFCLTLPTLRVDKLLLQISLYYQ